jgi:hypothetical protein
MQMNEIDDETRKNRFPYLTKMTSEDRLPVFVCPENSPATFNECIAPAQQFQDQQTY